MAADIKTPEAQASVNGVTLCYDSFGDASAPALLLIMGLGAQMVVWDDAFCAGLAQRGFRVVRFDNRDIGKSSRIDKPVKVNFIELIQMRMRGEPIQSPYTLRDMAADAVGLLDHLDIARAHVVGASMGGMIAQEMAIHFPARMLTLASIMSSTGNPALPPPTTRDEYLAGFVKTWRVLRGGSFPDDEARDPARAALTFDRGLNPMGVARQMLAIFVSGDRRAQLATVKVPTLVVHGAIDPLVPPEAGKDTAKSIPGARLQMIERMGHALPLETWPEIIEAIATHAGAHPA